ncbi:MAG: hypothetical protein AAGD14_02790 [Planctomycetota bacterium]
MIDPRQHLEEYIDGLLTDEESARVEAALRDDPELRAEYERARRFGALLDDLVVAPARRGRRPRAPLFALVATAVAAALFLWLRAPTADPVFDDLQRDWRTFGERLATIARERRDGRVPRTGLGDLEVPPAKAFGIVYAAGLPALGVDLDASVLADCKSLVRAHYERVRTLPDGVAGEAQRAEAALQLYRRLRDAGGRLAADAYYDLFRPGLVDSATVFRLEDGSLERALRDRAAYVRAYDEARRRLERRYGAQTVAVVLDRLAPRDARWLRRDATQDGANRDAVLAIRAELYRVAADTGADRLYVDVG